MNGPAFWISATFGFVSFTLFCKNSDLEYAIRATIIAIIAKVINPKKTPMLSLSANDKYNDLTAAGQIALTISSPLISKNIGSAITSIKPMT